MQCGSRLPAPEPFDRPRRRGTGEGRLVASAAKDGVLLRLARARARGFCDGTIFAYCTQHTSSLPTQLYEELASPYVEVLKSSVFSTTTARTTLLTTVHRPPPPAASFLSCPVLSSPLLNLHGFKKIKARILARLARTHPPPYCPHACKCSSSRQPARHAVDTSLERPNPCMSRPTGKPCPTPHQHATSDSFKNDR